MRLPAQSHSPSHNQGHVLSPSPGFNHSMLLGSGWRDYFAPSHADSPEQPGPYKPLYSPDTHITTHTQHTPPVGSGNPVFPPQLSVLTVMAC